MAKGRKKKQQKKQNEAKSAKESSKAGSSRENGFAQTLHFLRGSSNAGTSRRSGRRRCRSRLYLLVSTFWFIKKRTPSKLRVIIPELAVKDALVVLLFNWFLPGFGMFMASSRITENFGNIGQFDLDRKMTCRILDFLGILQIICYHKFDFSWIPAFLWGILVLVMAVKVVLERDHIEYVEVATLVQETRMVHDQPIQSQSTDYPNQHDLRLNDHTHNC